MYTDKNNMLESLPGIEDLEEFNSQEKMIMLETKEIKNIERTGWSHKVYYRISWNMKKQINKIDGNNLIVL